MFKAQAFVKLGVLVLLLALLGACGDDGGGGGGTDTFGNNDATDLTGQDTTATTGQDTTTTTTQDTTTTTTQDTTTTTQDTFQPPTDTVEPPARACTDAELTTLESCGSACAANDNPCMQACFGGLSAGCQTAYSALASCVQSAGCTATDATCIGSNCPNQVTAVYGTGPEPSNCDPVAGTGCTGGQVCSLVSSTEVGCVSAGSVAVGGDCSAAACASGACLTAGTASTCRPFCNPANNTCGDNRPCNIGLQGTTYTFCGDIPTNCNVLTQDCTGGEACYIINQAGDTDCAPSNGKTAGQACSYLNDCAAGLLCLGSATSAACTQACAVGGGAPTCTTGTCTSMGTDPVGSCQ